MTITEFTGELDAPAVIPFTGELDKPEVPKRTPTQEFLRQLGLTGRAGLTGVTGLASMAADVPFQLANIGRAAFDKPPLALPSAEQQKLFTRMGLPQAESTQENIVQALAQMIAGTGDPVSKALQAATVATPAAQAYGQIPAAVKAQTIKELGAAGYKIPPTIADAGMVARTVEGLGGRTRTAEMAATRNEIVTNKLARKALNLPKNTPLTPEVIKGTTDAAFNQGYKPIIEIGEVGIGRQFRNDLVNIVKELEGDMSFPAASKPEVLREVQKYLYNPATGRPLQAFTGRDAIIQARQLRLDASDAFKQGNNALGLAQRRIAKALEDNIELNLKGRGKDSSELLKNFKDARVTMAKAHAVEDALVTGTGSVDALKLTVMAGRGKKLTGELATIAKAGSVLRQAAAYPVKGTPPPVNLGDSILMGGAGIGAGFGFPALGGIAAIPFTRYGMRAATLSGPMQKALIYGSGQAPGPGIFGNPITQRAIPSLYPLFTGGKE